MSEEKGLAPVPIAAAQIGAESFEASAARVGAEIAEKPEALMIARDADRDAFFAEQLETIEAREIELGGFACCCPIPSGRSNKRLVAVSEDLTLSVRPWHGVIYIVDVDAFLIVAQLRGHEDTVLHMTMLPCKTKLVSGSLDGTIKVWNLPPLLRDLRRASTKAPPIVAACVKTMPVTAFPMLGWALLHSLSDDEGPFVATGSRESALHLWDLGSSDKPLVLAKPNFSDPIRLVARSDGGIAAVLADSKVAVWNRRSLAAASSASAGAAATSGAAARIRPGSIFDPVAYVFSPQKGRIYTLAELAPGLLAVGAEEGIAVWIIPNATARPEDRSPRPGFFVKMQSAVLLCLPTGGVIVGAFGSDLSVADCTREPVLRMRLVGEVKSMSLTDDSYIAIMSRDRLHLKDCRAISDGFGSPLQQVVPALADAALTEPKSAEPAGSLQLAADPSTPAPPVLPGASALQPVAPLAPGSCECCRAEDVGGRAFALKRLKPPSVSISFPFDARMLSALVSLKGGPKGKSLLAMAESNLLEDPSYVFVVDVTAPSSPKLLATLEGNFGPIQFIAQSRDCKTLITYAMNKHLRAWDITDILMDAPVARVAGRRSKDNYWDIHCPYKSIRCGTVHGLDGGLFVMCVEDAVAVIDLNASGGSRELGVEDPKFRVVCDSATAVTVLRNGDLVVGGNSSRGQVCIWRRPCLRRPSLAAPAGAGAGTDVPEACLGEPSLTFKAFADPVCDRMIAHKEVVVASIVELGDGSLAVHGAGGRIELWDILLGAPRLLTVMHLPDWNAARHMQCLLPAGLAITEGDPGFLLWDLAEGKCLGELCKSFFNSPHINPCVALLDNSRFVLGQTKSPSELQCVDLTVFAKAAPTGKPVSMAAKYASSPIAMASAAAAAAAGPMPVSPLWAVARRSRLPSRSVAWSSRLIAGVIPLATKEGSKAQILIGGGEDGVAVAAIDGSGDDRTFSDIVGLPGTVPASTVYALAVSSDSALLAAGFCDGSVRVWDVAEVCSAITCSPTQLDSVRSAASSFGKAQGKVNGSQSKPVIKAAEPLRSERVLKADRVDRVCSLAFMGDHRSLVSASLDGALRVWDCATGSEVQAIKAHSGAAWAVVVLRSGDVLSGGADRAIRVWRQSGCPASAAAAAAADGRLLNVTALTIYSAGMVISLAELPDGALAVGLFGEGGIEIWETSSAASGSRLLCTLPAQGWTVWSLCVLPGSILASGHDDGSVCTWDVSDPSNVKRVRRSTASHLGAVHGLSVLADGRLVSAGYDGRVHIW